MQRGEHEKINPFGEFAKENSNLLVEVLAPKRKAKRALIPDTNYWGLICDVQEMVDTEINPTDISNNEEDNDVEDIRKQMDI